MPPDIENDANPEGASSTPSGDQAAASSLETPAQPAAEPTLEQVAREAFDQSTSSQEEPAGEVQNTDKTEGKEPVEGEEPSTEEPASTENQEVPFHDHPRWQEVTKKAKDLEAKVEEMKPWEDAARRVQYHDAYMQENNISADDFKAVMSFLALRNSDPSAARNLIKPMWESLAAFDENFLPQETQAKIAKLEQAVKDSEISRPLADEQISLLKENAKAKSQQQLNEKRGRMTVEQQQRATAQSIGQTLVSWEQATTKKDPSFKPKAANARDGVYEITCAKYAYLASAKPPRNASEASTLVEQAYKEAKDLLTPAKTAARPNITSRNSSTASQTNGQPKTIADTVAAVARKHGYAWSPKRQN